MSRLFLHVFTTQNSFSSMSVSCSSPQPPTTSPPGFWTHRDPLLDDRSLLRKEVMVATGFSPRGPDRSMSRVTGRAEACCGVGGPRWAPNEGKRSDRWTVPGCTWDTYFGLSPSAQNTGGSYESRSIHRGRTFQSIVRLWESTFFVLPNSTSQHKCGAPVISCYWHGAPVLNCLDEHDLSASLQLRTATPGLRWNESSRCSRNHPWCGPVKLIFMQYYIKTIKSLSFLFQWRLLDLRDSAWTCDVLVAQIGNVATLETRAFGGPGDTHGPRSFGVQSVRSQLGMIHSTFRREERLKVRWRRLETGAKLEKLLFEWLKGMHFY